VIPAGTAIAPPAGPLRHRHALALLHGQPGLPADWQQVTARLPAQLHTIAVDRPGYGASEQPAGGFTAGARAVLGELDARGIQRAVLVGHSYGGGVALAAASLAPHRVEAVVLLASVGPGCLNRWDRLLAAPGAGPLCARVAWQLTPWIARAWLARPTRPGGPPRRPARHAGLEVWARASSRHSALWRTFLTEQRALLRELDELVASVPAVRAPVLLLADPADTLVPAATASQLARTLPDARLLLVPGAGHHLPRAVAGVVAGAIVAFVADLEAASGAGRTSRRAAGRPGRLAPASGCRSAGQRTSSAATIFR
jgi:pimeloyl-ACP methyl ester carboxylesterase